MAQARIRGQPPENALGMSASTAAFTVKRTLLMMKTEPGAVLGRSIVRIRPEMICARGVSE
jgi:hypothetical protein